MKRHADPLAAAAGTPRAIATDGVGAAKLLECVVRAAAKRKRAAPTTRIFTGPAAPICRTPPAPAAPHSPEPMPARRSRQRNRQFKSALQGHDWKAS